MSDDVQLIELVRAMWKERDAELRRDWDRSLPFGDAVFDRWDRARSLGFGAGASIYNSAFVFGPVSVGVDTWIGPNVILDGSGGGIQIGKTCSISAGVHIYTHDTVLWALSGGALPFNQAAVAIDDFCYIGSQSVIAAGVTIGKRCVIAANAFVNADIPDNTIVGGTPARPIGRVTGKGETVELDFSERASGR